MKKRALSLMLVMAMTAGMLAGCGTKDAADTKEDAGKEETAKEEVKEDDTDLEAEITWWNYPNFAAVDETAGKYEQGIIEAFNEKYPNIKVNIEMIDFASGPEKVTNAIQGGTVCDVLFDAPGRIIQYGKDGVLADLDDMFTEEFVADVDNEKLINACYVGDNAWMYPISSAPFLMAFNKTQLEEFGLLDMINLEGDRSWTVDQYQALIKALKEKGANGAVMFCVSQGGDQGTRAMLANLSGTPITNDDLTEYTINSDAAVEALQMIVDNVKDGYMLNGSAQDGTASIEEFVSGRSSNAILFSPGVYNNNKAKMEFEPVFLPFPTPEGVDPALEYLIDGFCVFDNGDENKIAASKLLIDFICNDAEWGPKNVVQTGTFPVRQSFGNLYEGDENMTYLASLTKYYSTYYNTIDGFAEMRTYWFPMLQAVLSGEDVKTALDGFVEQANQSIANAQ
ncbi:extracellular solute-binding protein [Anaerobium acetethylicum]|uniref:Multiple sugar transport system substrate-binding protein n=1 Tax=Anaerobium acetethylicum TaxID=1619234 RepID=A0A1D3TQ20_9FIRM|nr:extracellular solute-binding protein [Anaerobium acetethylicum]SCP95589.1 multiple sugar transport system substrate-binding protein [Anaerobium acetethylicum]